MSVLEGKGGFLRWEAELFGLGPQLADIRGGGTWSALQPVGVLEFTTASNWPLAGGGQGPATGFKHPT